MRLAREPEANSSRTLTKIWDSTLNMMGSHGRIEEGSDLMRLFQKDHGSQQVENKLKWAREETDTRRVATQELRQMVMPRTRGAAVMAERSGRFKKYVEGRAKQDLLQGWMSNKRKVKNDAQVFSPNTWVKSGIIY